MTPKEVAEKVSALEAENERLKNSEAHMGALLEWIEVALEGGRLSDFAESFPIVRKAVDAVQMARQEAEFLKCERDEALAKLDAALLKPGVPGSMWQGEKAELRNWQLRAEALRKENETLRDFVSHDPQCPAAVAADALRKEPRK